VARVFHAGETPEKTKGVSVRIHRYMTHALVLAIAGAISGYATFDRPFFASSHASR